MPCYHPLKGFKIGTNPSTGKDKLRITPYKTDHVELRSDGKYYNIDSPDVSPFARSYNDFVDIPCGRCIGCRLQRAKAWADRAVLELPYHDSNLFITLTYDDDHLPISEEPNPDTGEYLGNATLKKRDIQLFWKRLRKYIDTEIKKAEIENKKPYYEKIRLLYCGEYGSVTKRPHYHAIVFGLKLPDLYYWKTTRNGDRIYRSNILESIWKNGIIYIGEATHESIGYVARYTTKKLYGDDKEVYNKLGIEPEFVACSRRPGLGRQYYEENKEKMFNNTKYFFPVRHGVGSAYPSRYFNNLFESDFAPERVELRKEQLKNNFENSKLVKLCSTDLEYLDYLAVEEYNKKQQIKTLKRNEI